MSSDIESYYEDSNSEINDEELEGCEGEDFDTDTDSDIDIDVDMGEEEETVADVDAGTLSKTSMEKLNDALHGAIMPTFNFDGKLRQVEFAHVCACKGEPSVGIMTKNGVAIVSQRKITNPLIESDSVMKIADVNENIGMVYSGHAPDFRQIVRQARKIAINFTVAEGSSLPVMALPHELGTNLQECTQTCSVRPFGLLILIAGWHKNRAYLYRMDCIGSYEAVKASAIGINSMACNDFLRVTYSSTLFLEAAISLAIQTLKMACNNDDMTAKQLDVAYIDANGFHQMPENEIEYVLSHLR